ncbi:hypothetical protein B0H13DRAFT_1851436 [Mycena leptocephala]|nr:hypothetical protein B0H13DRAFT_1851436 [Mycena leptocephala]
MPKIKLLPPREVPAAVVGRTRKKKRAPSSKALANATDSADDEYVPSHTSQTPSAPPHHTFRKPPPPQSSLATLATPLDQDSLCSQYGPFLVELQKHLGEFTVYPHVICWLNEKLRARYQPWYQGNLVSDEKTVEDWVRYPHGTSKYSLAVFETWTVSPRAVKIEDFGQIPWHVWAIVICHAPPPRKKGKKIFVWDPNFGDPVAGVRERDVLLWRKEFVETAKFSAASAQVWVNKQWGEPNLGGDCVRLTLRWLQAVAEQGFDLNIFYHAAKR